MGERWLRYTVEADETGKSVQEILTGVMGVSRRRIQKLTRSRGILLGGRPAFLGRKVRAGDVLSVRSTDAEAPTLEPVEMPLSIVYEDATLLVVDKMPGVLVHPTAPQHRATLAHGIAHHLATRGESAPVRPVHRLDRDTSGLLLVAKSAMAHAALDRQLREGGIRREYLVWVAGRPADPQGRIDAPVGRKPGDPRLRAVVAGGDPAATRYRVVGFGEHGAVLEAELETGRTHQIRVHLAHLGHPLLGDRAYGGPRIPGLRRAALHATRLTFDHPVTGEPVRLEAPVPPDLARLGIPDPSGPREKESG
jgi:23S rRNA pseudouridine1911/1915/1917 synthase